MGRENYPAGYLLLWSNGQVVNIIPKVFPEPPTSYTEIKTISQSEEFVAPENGYYQIVAASKGGNGARGVTNQLTNWWKRARGGGGGTPAISRKSLIKLSEGEKLSLVIESNGGIRVPQIGISISPGQNGTSPRDASAGGSGGAGGKASGGDENIQGKYGASGVGNFYDQPGTSFQGGSSTALQNSYGLSCYGGGPGGDYETRGSAAVIKIYRGNTNIPLDVQNARDITTNALAITALAQEQTGILLGTLA